MSRRGHGRGRVLEVVRVGIRVGVRACGRMGVLVSVFLLLKRCIYFGF